MANASLRHERMKKIALALLEEIGEDPRRDGLKDTPRRWADWWEQIMCPPDDRGTTTFDTVRVNQLVVVRGIEVWSICEHHLLPYRCELAIGYIATKRLLGLSKFVRIARNLAGALTLQEGLVNDVAISISAAVKSEDVAVIGRGVHLCLAMRGVRTNAEMVTSVMLGTFRENLQARLEVLAMMEKRA